jgi:hypothetical protein
VRYLDISNQLYEQVKEAALSGSTLGEIVQAWSAANDDPVFVKAAFDQFVPRLFNERVFRNLNEMGDSLTKTAGRKMVNLDHPLVQHYSDFCSILTKLASLRMQQEELLENCHTADVFMQEVMKKEAIGGVLGSIVKGYGEHVVPAAASASKVMTGSKAPGEALAYGLPIVGAAAGTYALAKELQARGLTPQAYQNHLARVAYEHGVQ